MRKHIPGQRSPLSTENARQGITVRVTIRQQAVTAGGAHVMWAWIQPHLTNGGLLEHYHPINALRSRHTPSSHGTRPPAPTRPDTRPPAPPPCRHTPSGHGTRTAAPPRRAPSHPQHARFRPRRRAPSSNPRRSPTRKHPLTRRFCITPRRGLYFFSLQRRPAHSGPERQRKRH